MTLALKTKSKNQTGGFTLIELVMTMLIAAILMGSAVMLLSKQTRDPFDEVELEISSVIREAKKKAIESGEARYIEAGLTGFSISAVNHLDFGDGDSGAGRELAYKLPSGANLSYRRLEQAGWKSISSNSDLVIWCVSRTGMLEKIYLRVEMDGGHAEMSFDPLTGNLIR